MKLFTWLEGKKTYLIAGAMLVHALSGWVLGEEPNWNEVLSALGLASLRGGVGKISTAPPSPQPPTQ